MKNGLIIALLVFFTGTAHAHFTPVFSGHKMTSADTAIASVPLGGNAWVSKTVAGGMEKIGDNGLSGWTSAQAVISIYFRVEKPGNMRLALKMKVPDGRSIFRISVAEKSDVKTASGKNFSIIRAGNVSVKKAGYVKVDIQGISKTGASFGEVSDLLIDVHPAEDAVFTKNNTDNYFYWGRRGPSVHLRYTLPDEAKDNIEWFYNEITVNPGDDTEGSYYMANGFAEGYFGMQVNSKTERRVLFSIWSPFTTDNPKTIPDSMKIMLLKKGENVKTGEFGNEGSGGQSYLIYSWKAGKTYAFLTHAKPDAVTHTTVFTSYFKESNEKTWKLIASFRRPQTNTNLKSLYSFLENFNPETGFTGRKGLYGNQWIRSTSGNWYELTEATFTADATARKNYRKDYAGGIDGKSFYLRNCGFFADFTPINTVLKRASSGKGEPVIDVKD